MTDAQGPAPVPATLLDAFPDAVLVLDEDEQILQANEGAHELLGYPPGALMGIGLDRLIAGGELRLRDPVGRAAPLRTRVELEAAHFDGHLVAVEVSLAWAELIGQRVIVVTMRSALGRERVAELERAAAVIEDSPDAILTIDLHGTITSWNRGAERLYGYTAEEAVGQPWTMVMPSDRIEEMRDVLASVRRGQTIDRLETVRVPKHGRSLDISLSVAPVRGERGVVVGVATVARDITERLRQEALTLALLESAPDAVVVVGEGGRIVLVNRQTEELFGRTRGQLHGQNVELLMPERVRGGDYGGFGYFTDPSRGQAGALELVGLRSDGDEFPIEITFNPLETADGWLIYASIRDISERKLIESELRRSNHDLEQFAYVASHDLSEPLRVIAGFVDLLARRYRGALDEDADRFIDFIISGVERMQMLIDDILAYSRAGRVQIDSREIDVGEVVQDVLAGLLPDLEAKGVTIEVAELPRVYGERALLRQVFLNLITNAVKFCDSEQPLVKISANQLRRAWRIDIEDNGPGIDPRHTERIFEMFQRLHGREVRGSGIGLAIVKRLTERMGGSVWVTPAQPRGSIFSFTIPDRA